MEKNGPENRTKFYVYLLLGLTGLLLAALTAAFLVLCRQEPGPGPITVLHISGELFCIAASAVITMGLSRVGNLKDSIFRNFLRINVIFTFLMGVDIVLWLELGWKAEGAKFWMTVWYILPMAIQIFAYTYLFYRMNERSRKLEKNMRKFMSRNVEEKLSSDGISWMETEEETKATVMFCQIHRFEDYVGNAQPKDVVRVLRFFFSEVSGIMEKYGGTVLSFPGHCVLCIFGAPATMEDEETMAVRAALEIQLEMRDFAEICTAVGLPPVTAGIGIDTGIVNVGSVGDDRQKRFTVIGQTVNLASRIESYSADGEVLIAESTKAALKPGFRTESAGLVSPKGIDKAVEIFRVTGADGE